MQIVLADHNRVPRSHTTDLRVHVSHGKMAIIKKGERIILPQIIRVRRSATGMLPAMINRTTSQLAICKQSSPQKQSKSH